MPPIPGKSKVSSSGTILNKFPTDDRVALSAPIASVASFPTPLPVPIGSPIKAPSKLIRLRIHQVRVLRAIGYSNGPINRALISKKANISSTVVSRALGYSNPEKRAKFEADDPCGGYPSLITLGYITEHNLDIDGVIETSYSLTPSGIAALEATKGRVLPKPKG